MQKQATEKRGFVNNPIVRAIGLQRIVVVLAVILFREFAVAGVRCLAAADGTVIAANVWGKVKTVLQMVTIILYYAAAALAPADAVGLVQLGTQVLCWLVAAATLLSGVIYLWQNRACFMQAK